jgi:hypothetical protein
VASTAASTATTTITVTAAATTIAGSSLLSMAATILPDRAVGLVLCVVLLVDARPCLAQIPRGPLQSGWSCSSTESEGALMCSIR